MIVCIPINGEGGLNQPVAASFTHCKYYGIIDLDTERIQIIENENKWPIIDQIDRKFQGVVCRTMGKRAVEILNSKGIKVFQAKNSTISEILEQYKKGELVELT